MEKCKVPTVEPKQPKDNRPIRCGECKMKWAQNAPEQHKLTCRYHEQYRKRRLGIEPCTTWDNVPVCDNDYYPTCWK